LPLKKLDATVQKTAPQFMNLASKVFNYDGESRIEQEQCNFYGKFCRKMERKS
jgi:hypothetical protein